MFGQRVLVIDLDPQTNATTMLIGEEAWKSRNAAGHTLATLFKDTLTPNERCFDCDKTLVRGVSDVQGAERIDLLPSSLDLIDVQDKLAGAPAGRFHATTPVDTLRLAVRSLFDQYEFVLIDCPPNLGLITLNGLRISSNYIIPTIPDRLSTYGIPQIINRVGAFSTDIQEKIRPLGILLTKFQQGSTVHTTMSAELRGKPPGGVPLFDVVIPQANQIAAAGEFIPLNRRTLKQKYGYQGLAESYVDLARELMHRLGL